MEVGADHGRDRDQVAVVADAPGASLGVLAGAIVGDRLGPADRDLVVDFTSSCFGCHDQFDAGAWPRGFSALPGSIHCNSSNRAASSAARSGSESIRMCSSSAWAPPPRAQAVERRDSQGRGEVAVAAAAGRALGQLQAEVPADALRLLEQRRDGGRSLHRGPVEHPLTVSRVSGVIGHERPKGRFDPRSLPPSRRPARRSRPRRRPARRWWRCPPG